jgi:hypothetical protein
VTGGGFSTTIRFNQDVDLDERTIVVTGEYRLAPRVGLQLGVGAILDGNARVGQTNHDVGAGFALTVAGSWLIAPEGEALPFVLAGISLGGSTAPAGPENITAVDARLSIVVGKTFAEAFTPYVVGRVFGGPVFWSIGDEGVVGGDSHHYAVGFGASLRTGAFDLFAEWLPAGERSVNLGVGWSW